MFPLKYYDAIAFGKINDAQFRLPGDGKFDHPNGRVYGLYDIEDLPPTIDALIFNAVLVTGYPSVCKTATDVRNPFLFGSYSYEREVQFETGHRITYQAQCEADIEADRLRSTFSLCGTAPELSLHECLPLTESWQQLSDGQISGQFSIQWLRTDGQLLTAHAKTLYTPPVGAPRLTSLYRRAIELKNGKSANRKLTIDQVSVLNS